MSERDRITELEHRIGQATMMAESIAMEGGACAECALRFLVALDVPRAGVARRRPHEAAEAARNEASRLGRHVPRSHLQPRERLQPHWQGTRRGTCPDRAAL